jgi:hypothetical protein
MSKNRTTTQKGKCGDAQHNEHLFYKDSDRDVLKMFGEISKYREILKSKNLEELEKYYYLDNYASMLAKQNEKYMASRQYKRCKSIDDIYSSKRYQPTEEIIQYGNMNTKNKPTKDDMQKMVGTYVLWLKDWSSNHGNHLHILDATIHMDEASPHCHLRYIWDYEKDGILTIGQEEAMKQAGLPLPNPKEEVGRHNNRNMEFTKMCRSKWQDICESYGYEVERIPVKQPEHQGKASHKDIANFKYEKAKEINDLLNAVSEDYEKVSLLLQKTNEISQELQKYYKSMNDSKKQEKVKETIELLQKIQEELPTKEKQDERMEMIREFTMSLSQGSTSKDFSL